eukprot:TRINITY_DN3865_c0_g1_i1.p1 TRINITY_DN3865_c0_g1~~TRINITY_DN3865_c0_g1_i1.p1  ORF type:complete len:143 (+),score=14.64 TRINITY_DN3865_c0_g1_i1:125-553(+)
MSSPPFQPQQEPVVVWSREWPTLKECVRIGRLIVSPIGNITSDWYQRYHHHLFHWYTLPIAVSSFVLLLAAARRRPPKVPAGAVKVQHGPPAVSTPKQPVVKAKAPAAEPAAPPSAMAAPEESTAGAQAKSPLAADPTVTGR